MVTSDPIRVFHFSPELVMLLTDAIALVCRSKRDVLMFFRSAGVGKDLTADVEELVRTHPEQILKRDIARTTLVRLNERGDAMLLQRREVVRRVVETTDLASCWPDDRLKAKGLIGSIRELVGTKDAFTRMEMERDRERAERIAIQQRAIEAKRIVKERKEAAWRELCAVFREPDPHRRGKALEAPLNRIFEIDGIGIREAFTLKGTDGEGIVEQIDGVIEVDGEIYLVEVKWWGPQLDPGCVSQHIVRVFHRSDARGILISASGYTPAAVAVSRDALQHRVVILCDLKEFVDVLEGSGSLSEMLRRKVTAAIVDRNPYLRWNA